MYEKKRVRPMGGDARRARLHREERRGKEREGDLKTTLGTFGFNRAFGLADDPWCALDYVKVDDTHYWDCNGEAARYNTLVTTGEYRDFDKEASERIADCPDAYRYVLNTTWNEERIPGKGSAIFLHSQREGRTYTAGCIAIPEKAMEYVMRHVRPETKILIRLKDLSENGTGQTR
ncbi:MAG: L,D-transpeptidase family protein [Kiritimatiellae bacterium]|nr:L,D-transpeptidase family protein [Kiritimatiellia bacterium]